MGLNNIPDTVRVLLVDDDEEDYIIIKRHFISMKSLHSQLDWVSSSDEAIEAINRGEYDAYLIDYRIDGRTGLDVLEEVKAGERAEPFILLTGVGDQSIARESLALSASDYIVKKGLTSEDLARTLYYALGRKEQEQQRLDHLRELNRSKDEFISIASHQLRTPATSVKQYVAMVLDGIAGDMTEKQRTLLTRAYKSNERQLSIINNLLRVAQIDTGTVKLNVHKADIGVLTSEAVEDLRPIYATRQQRLEYRAVDGTISAEVDSDAIRMVIDNLIENASKYSKPGTTTTVSVAVVDEAVVVTVADQGVGVAHPERLFTKFSRIDNELSNVVDGTGIGLYWAASIVDLHGGTLTYQPNQPVGSKFILSLSLVK